jgi:hypothetical protein
VRNALEQVARDEEEHAALAWRMLAWAVRTAASSEEKADSAVARVLREIALDDDEHHGSASLETKPWSKVSSERDLSAHGVLTRAEERVIRARIVEDVIRPCLRALLEAT